MDKEGAQLLRTTMGQLLVNEALPEDLRDYSRHLDKKGTAELLQQVAEKYPEQYSEVAHKLLKVGERASYENGMSITLKDLQVSPAVRKASADLKKAVHAIASSNKLSRDEKGEKIIELASKAHPLIVDAVMSEARAGKNRIADMADTGVRGKPQDVSQILGPVMLVADQNKNTIPLPILNSYADGLDPAEYALASFGVRAAYTDIKLATPKAGYLSKQLTNAAHRIIASDTDPLPGTGYPVDAGDPDNVGAALAADYGPYKAGSIITSKMLKDLARKNKRILVHSPISAIAPGGAVPRLAFGVREKLDLPDVRASEGITAAQAITEPVSQTAISSKHQAGAVSVAGKHMNLDVGAGFGAIEQLTNIPKNFPGAAAVATLSGRVAEIKKAPQGGAYITIDGHDHYVDLHSEARVKVGDHVDEGDVLSSGIPNPAEIVKYKGVGEGRRYFVDQMRKTLKESGIKANRRNIEILSRGLINHIQIGDNQMGQYLPGDIVPYDDFASKYVARPDSKISDAKQAVGQYLEQPALHYSIGTRITKKVADELHEFGLGKVFVHKDKPGFEPVMMRSVDVSSVDDDPMVRMGGFNLQKNLLDAVHRGKYTESHGTSYIPAIAQATEFGRAGPDVF